MSDIHSPLAKKVNPPQSSRYLAIGNVPYRGGPLPVRQQNHALIRRNAAFSAAQSTLGGLR